LVEIQHISKSGVIPQRGEQYPYRAWCQRRL